MNKTCITLSAFFLPFSLLLLAAYASDTKQEDSSQYMGDSWITTKVKAAILDEPNLKAAEIKVGTIKGIVQLSGLITSNADSAKALQAAHTVKGVKSVKNDLIMPLAQWTLRR
ncbi:BON domain-containing protein [Iodobacter arcticus]|uniref:BON domain-containing protein n=1 Tax=Iodobacter arcticus TaxID=590593 RepID=A0ABW2QUH4_9NEIS